MILDPGEATLASYLESAEGVQLLLNVRVDQRGGAKSANTRVSGFDAERKNSRKGIAPRFSLGSMLSSRCSSYPYRCLVEDFHS